MCLANRVLPPLTRTDEKRLRSGPAGGFLFFVLESFQSNTEVGLSRVGKSNQTSLLGIYGVFEIDYGSVLYYSTAGVDQRSNLDRLGVRAHLSVSGRREIGFCMTSVRSTA